VCDAVGVLDSAVPGEAVEHESETLVAFHIAGTLEEFIEHRADQILRRGDEACNRNFVGKIPANQAVVIGEVDCHLHE
jgi:hypothetical protein